MIRSILLSGTAIATALVTTPLIAGSVGTGNNMNVSLSGEVRFQAHTVSQDKDSSVRQTGFKTDEAEMAISASNTSDNGFSYGVDVVLNVNTDDTTNGDKVWATISSDSFGTLQLGDVGGAADNAGIGGENVLAGRAGFDGELGDVFDFGSTFLGTGNDPVSGGATKISYYTPDINGFQLGVSFTPDAGAAGASFGEKDNNGSYEDVISVGASYSAELSGANISAAVTYEFGENEIATNASAEALGVGATATFGNYSIGVGYANFYDTGLTTADVSSGQDAGTWYSVGVGYAAASYNVSLGYYQATVGNGGSVGDSVSKAISIDADTSLADGWTLAASVSFSDAENRGRVSGDDNSGTSVIIYNIWSF
ncbi:MAG: hypothetical protein CL568_06785 [Alphaproteobacteria bacterium]|nr:hypothetical protein [Alphaproteobacteria bacterium]PPR13031.1 MAG: hypothetical protein CFH42_01452 [Alphaproteobacteria bacterium MarineAlpha12_Bin1]|tara:strand:- start:1266 stop:2369 length:1104 start_codon:yes stop_codon:yes gene_type:complete